MTTPGAARETVLDRWRALRDAGRLGALLPQCIDRSWGDGDQAYGFVTADYRVYRDFTLPSGPAGGPPPMADLIELYWSVRTRGRRQDPNWAAALNAHVVRVVAGPAAAADLDELYRQVVTLRRALQIGGTGPLVADGASVALHARGLLLAPELSAPVAIVERLASHADIPLTVGRYRLNDAGGLEFAGAADGAPRWEVADVSEEELTSLGRRLVQHDLLVRLRGQWAPDPGHDWDDEGNPLPRRRRDPGPIRS